MNILTIETTCDETAAVVDRCKPEDAALLPLLWRLACGSTPTTQSRRSIRI